MTNGFFASIFLLKKPLKRSFCPDPGSKSEFLDNSRIPGITIAVSPSCSNHSKLSSTFSLTTSRSPLSKRIGFCWESS